jgi:hypothetical protein
MTRLILYFATAFLIAYDVACMVFGWPTLSYQIRESDAELGGLIRFGMIALWFHWFCPIWTVKNGL